MKNKRPQRPGNETRNSDQGSYVGTASLRLSPQTRAAGKHGCADGLPALRRNLAAQPLLDRLQHGFIHLILRGCRPFWNRERVIAAFDDEEVGGRLESADDRP